MQPASVAIDEIVYLASLASQPAELDVILDPFRAITSRIDRQQPLNPADAAVVQGIKQELQTYLTTREKLRHFTPESLSLQLEQHFKDEANGSVNHNRRRLLFAAGLSLVTAITLSVGLPLHDPRERGMVGGATLFALLHVSSAWFFLNALSSFSSSLRRAFTFIATGVTIIGLSLVEQPLEQILNLSHYIAASILFALGILTGALFFFAGGKLYAQAVGVRSRWVSVTPLVAIGMPLMIISLLLPLPQNLGHEQLLVAHLPAMLWSWIAASPIAALIYMPRVAQLLPELYKPPIRALYQAFWLILAVTGYQYYLMVTDGPNTLGTSAYILFALVIMMGAMLLRAGYTFNKISRY